MRHDSTAPSDPRHGLYEDRRQAMIEKREREAEQRRAAEQAHPAKVSGVYVEILHEPKR